MKIFNILLVSTLMTLFVGLSNASHTQIVSLLPCDELGDLAVVIMKARQEGTSLSEMRNRATGFHDTESQRIVLSMVMEAYEVSRYSSDNYKLIAQQDFREKLEMSCYKLQDSTEQSAEDEIEAFEAELAAELGE